MQFIKSLTVAGLFVIVFLLPAGYAAKPEDDSELLKVREQVWRAWFANDTKTLHELVPAETVVFSGSEKQWKHQEDVLREAVEFQQSGGKLVRLEFPRTEVEHLGDTAIVWSNFILETEVNGKREVSSSRISEIFVRRKCHWVNPGWHSDPSSHTTE